MADSLLSKPFNEGAPLDPNALNDLVTDIKNTYAKTALFNSTLEGQTQQYKYLNNCGEIPVDVTVGVSGPWPIDIGSGFESTPQPIVTATLRMTSAPAKDQNLNVYIVAANGSSNFQAYIVSSVKKSNVYISWNAIQKLPA